MDVHTSRMPSDGILEYGVRDAIARTIRDEAGLAILPSDSGYSLAASPFLRSAMERVRLLRGAGASPSEPISLAFGSPSLVQRYARLEHLDHRIVCRLPGPVTLVCDLLERHRSLEKFLRTEGTIGVRLPQSVEQQISMALDAPITTCAIRRTDGTIIREFGEALAAIRERTRTVGPIPVYALEGGAIRNRTHSTVLTCLQRLVPAGARFQILRPGQWDARDVQDALSHLSPQDVDDWT